MSAPTEREAPLLDLTRLIEAEDRATFNGWLPSQYLVWPRRYENDPTMLRAETNERAPRLPTNQPRGLSSGPSQLTRYRTLEAAADLLITEPLSTEDDFDESIPARLERADLPDSVATLIRAVEQINAEVDNVRSWENSPCTPLIVDTAPHPSG